MIITLKKNLKYLKLHVIYFVLKTLKMYDQITKTLKKYTQFV